MRYVSWTDSPQLSHSFNIQKGNIFLFLGGGNWNGKINTKKDPPLVYGKILKQIAEQKEMSNLNFCSCPRVRDFDALLSINLC